MNAVGLWRLAGEIEASVKRELRGFPRCQAARVAKVQAALMFHTEIEGIFSVPTDPSRPLGKAASRLLANLKLIKESFQSPYTTRMLADYNTRDRRERRGMHQVVNSTIGRGTSSIESETAKLYQFIYGFRWQIEKEDYVHEAIGFLRRRLTLNGIRLKWFRNKTCLDAGCGMGRTTLALSSLGAKLVIGVDYGSYDSLSLLKKFGRGTTNGFVPIFARANLEELPFPDNTFDFVLCQGVLHHMRRPRRGIVEIHRVLKPGGRVWLYVYGRNLYQRVLKTSRSLLADIPHELAYDIMLAMNFRIGLIKNFLDNLFVPIKSSFRKAEIEDLLRSVGFRKIVRHERDIETVHYTPPAERVFRGERFSRLKFSDGDFRYLAEK